MKSFLTNVLSVCALSLLFSCAATYRPINPLKIDYPSIGNEDVFSYKYNVLKSAGNKKLVKKENKEHVNIVAVKFVNTTGKPLIYGQNFKIYSASNEVSLIDPEIAAASIKQTAPAYLLYLLLTPMKLNVSDGESASATPVGYVLGPALAAGNYLIASNANKNFKKELLLYNIIDKEIKSGETFYGLIALADNGFAPLSIKLVQ